MTEIPRDGKRYLAWDVGIGIVLVWWQTTDTDGDFYFASPFAGGPYHPKSFISRWMDERGQWHELNNSCTPNICKRCRKEVVDSIDDQIKFLSESGELKKPEARGKG